MTTAGILILAGFLVFAALMVLKILPALLALPLMAGWTAFAAGLSPAVYLNDILIGGAMKLGSAMTVVIFGAVFARITMKTGISSSIVKKAAELAGDQPRTIAYCMYLATAFVFLGMSGLGAVIMIGSIALPIMMTSGISPLVAASVLLLGLLTGLSGNAANYGTYIGLFGGNTVSSFYLPAVIIALAVSLVFIARNVPPSEEEGSKNGWLRLPAALLKAVLTLPYFLLRGIKESLAKAFSRKDSCLVTKKESVPAAALAAPVIPLLTVYFCKLCIGFGKAAQGHIDPIAAAVLGFLLASLYAVILTGPGQLIQIFAGALVEGIRDVAGVLFLFMGIGMLVAAVMNPSVSGVLNPILKAVIPEQKYLFLLFFAVFAPAALYRGPLNMFGMGAGIAVLLLSLPSLDPFALCGAFIAVQFVQGASDPTNSHNAWISGFTGADTTAMLKKTLPYTWLMCVLFLLWTAWAR